MNKLTDKQIIEILNQQPQKGMELLMEAYTGLVFKVISFHLSNPEDIRECTNDTFAEFYFHRASYDAQKASLPVYLTAIARYLAISRYRKEKKHMGNETLTEIPVEDKTIFLAEVQADLSRALQSLKNGELQIIRMKYYGGMTIAEIADSLDLPYETVKKRHQRSIIKLRQTLLLSLILFIVSLFSVSTYAVLRHFNIIPPLFSIEKTQDPEEDTEAVDEETSDEETKEYSSPKTQKIIKKEKKKANSSRGTTESPESTESFSDIRISTEAKNNTKASAPEQTEHQKKENETLTSDISSDSPKEPTENDTKQEWSVPDTFTYIPDYGVKKVSGSPTYTLEATAFAEDEVTSISVVSASLIDKKLTVTLQAVSKTKPFVLEPGQIIEDYTRQVNNAENYVLYRGQKAAISVSSMHNHGNAYISTEVFEGDNFEPDVTDEGSIMLTMKCFDLTLSFTLIKTKEETIEDESLYQMKKYGGLMIQPRLVDGHLKIAIHTLNKDEYITLPGLVRGSYGEKPEDGILTATDSTGNVLEGSCIRYYPGCKTYLEWDFGLATPGTYSLHIPFLCQIPAESERINIPIDFVNRTWDSQPYEIPGAKIWISDISEPYTLPTDTEEDTNDSVYEDLTVSFYNEDEKHRIQSIYGYAIQYEPPSSDFRSIISSMLSTDVENCTATLQTCLTNNRSDSSITELEIHERMENNNTHTPVYYRWDESFDFTFTVK